MSEISFAKPTAETQPQPVHQEKPELTPEAEAQIVGPSNPTVAIATRPNNAAVGTPLPLGDTIPDFNDIILPRINIVQKVGELSNLYTHGAIVFNQSVVLYEPPVLKDGAVVKPGTEALDITVLGFKAKRFVERIEGGAKGQIVLTEDAVVKAGGTLSYPEWELKKTEGIRLFQPLSEALIAVYQPSWVKDEAGSTFVYESDGRKLALALWGMKGTAYTAGAKTFFTARAMGVLRKDGYPSWSWNLSTQLKKFGANFVFVPVLTAKQHSSAAFVEFARQVLTGS